MKVSVGDCKLKIFLEGLGLLAKGGSGRFMFFLGGSFFQRVKGGLWGAGCDPQRNYDKFSFQL